MIIFDLDGSLADCSHRRHFVTPPKECKYIFTDSIPHDNGCILTGEYTFQDGKKWKPDWKAFFEACDQDKPIVPVINIFKSLIAQNKEIQIWSGRCESVREKTIDWIIKYLGLDFYSDFEVIELKMRPIGDYTPDEQLKERWLDEHIASGGKPIEFIFDDRPKVVRMWRRRGIFVFDCNQSGEEF